MNARNLKTLFFPDNDGLRLVLLILMLCLSSPTWAEIYKYLGSDGTIHFTDRPMVGKYRLLWRSGPSSASSRNAYTGARFKKNKSKLTPLIDQTASQVRLHPGLLHAIVMAESAYNPKAKSNKGALGLMQLMPATADRYGVDDSFDPQQNLKGGARYLKDLLEEFEFDLKLALAAYNAGESAVRKYGNQIPPYPETQQYVRKVLGYYKQNMQSAVN
jgi:soluble lytic murein transglycosylase-like protein